MKEKQISMKKNILFIISPIVIMAIIFILASGCVKVENAPQTSNTATDGDGNTYKTVTIGTQVWMAENLKTTKYNDGTSIPLVTETNAWYNLTTDGFCWYNNDESNKNTYGALYNWRVVKTGKLAPKGWHVPSDEEWQILENYLLQNAYNYDSTLTKNKLAKSLSCDTGWVADEGIGTVGNSDYPLMRNKTGFSALPGGFRDINGDFKYQGVGGYWWGSAEGDLTYAWYRLIGSNRVDFWRSSIPMDMAYSIRCIKD